MTDGLTIGDRVELSQRPPYLKTADSMPMLRPPDLVLPGEQGTILDQRPGGYWVVQFERGTFLFDSEFLAKVLTHGEGESPLLPESLPSPSEG